MLLADFLDGVIKLLNAGFHLVEQSHQGTYSDNIEFHGRNIANGRNRRVHLFGPGRCFRRGCADDGEGMLPGSGSGANSEKVAVGSRLSRRLNDASDYAAKAARQISGMVAVVPPNLPILNCPFLIFSTNSTPPITTAAVRKLFRPSIRPSRCFTRR